jgi:outer membrane lipoprotein-sorting protein
MYAIPPDEQAPLVKTCCVIAVLFLHAILLTGCTCENLPTYPHLTAIETQKHLSDQAHQLHTVSAEGTITLTKPDGQSIRFDGALVMQPPDQARLRAWKFGQAIFDLTFTDGAIWLVAPSDSSHREDIRRAGAGAGELARTFLSLLGGYFDSNDLIASEQGSTIRFSQRGADNITLACDVDRNTLTARRYMLSDSDGQVRFALILERYVMINSIPWPQRIVAVSDSGRVQVDLRNIEINTDLAPAAFKPPKRAEKLATEK